MYDGIADLGEARHQAVLDLVGDRIGKDYETAVYSPKDFIWDKADLLVPVPADAKVPAAAQ